MPAEDPRAPDPWDLEASRWRHSDDLDAGCGAGRRTRSLAEAGAHVVGIDTSRPALSCRPRLIEGPSRALRTLSIPRSVALPLDGADQRGDAIRQRLERLTEREPPTGGSLGHFDAEGTHYTQSRISPEQPRRSP